ncbi:energy transducer TonB [Adhaeribacter pallidiroseus]|uniref:TonB C-terminal domain-containing protein n=1 Tax=Adhaeribacter pallidiroseus TaxID=2072847 RepID=A0A369QBV8_9BACT|nr:energy transducer TonB [Adhaeribacter pallidiroseus]RDC62381.1 hypothetical protein AHMF7616_00974 [Adhaeribacter pallidiroseus]
MINSHPSPQTEPIGFHLTQEKLFQLLTNEVTPAEKQQMEVHLQTCPLCTEALEGFAQADYLKSRADLLELNHLIKKRTTRRKPNTLVNDIKTWGIATAIVFLILISAAIVWNAVHMAKTTSTLNPGPASPGLNAQAQPVKGYKNLKNYLLQQQNQPAEPSATTALKKGSVVISFTVNPDSSLTDFQVIKSLGKTTDETVINWVKQGPVWQPAHPQGKPVAQKITLPVIIR